MRFSRWTLRTRLIALTTLLVAVACIIVGGVVAIVLSKTLSDRFDSEILSVRGPGLQMIVNGSGQFVDRSDYIVVLSDATSGGVQGVYTGDSKRSSLTSAQIQQVVSRVPAPTSGADPSTHDATVSTYGEYRFAVSTYDSGFTVYVGKPLSELRSELAAVLAPIVVIVLLAVLLAALLGALVIGRALRPLRRVAAVASAVAEMPLERGEVQLAQRVPDADTDPHTEVGQVGSALNALLDSVETALVVRQASEEKVRTFVADASHELRTPLASIRGYAELTRRFGGDLSETVQHNIARIESESQRMTSLVEDLLLLARLDAERELDSTEVDLSRLLLDVLSDAHAAGPDHEWDIDLPPEPVLVFGDDAKLHQVFTNLLANARVHTPAGTKVSIELSEPDDGSAVVVVRDEGPGIPADLQPKLFERFARGDSSRTRSTGSTGLGLSIVQAVVAAHHGEVSVTSKPGSTVFTVRLPQHQPARREPVPA